MIAPLRLVTSSTPAPLAQDGERQRVENVLVETGAELCWLPSDVLEALGIERQQPALALPWRISSGTCGASSPHRVDEERGRFFGSRRFAMKTSNASGSNGPPAHSSILSCSLCFGLAMASTNSA